MSTISAVTRKVTRRVTWSGAGLWVVQIALATQFAGAGMMKLSGDQALVEMFADIGAGQWLRYAVGLLEVAGALGLLVSRLCGLAAAGLVALMTGAIVTNVFVLHESPLLPAVYLLVAAVIGWFRRPQIVRRGR
jgi:uncharacterized membrane protein YphA (DoxX/SURF4 family)